MNCHLNDELRFSATFTDSAGTLTDAWPTFSLRSPADVVTEYTGAQVVHHALGQYRVDVVMDELGTWSYWWESIALVRASSEPVLFTVSGDDGT